MATTAKISRDDLETKLREMSGGVEDTVEAARPTLISSAVAGVLLVALVAYLLGAGVVGPAPPSSRSARSDRPWTGSWASS